MTTPIAGLPEISESQANKAVTHNQALRQLEINVGAVVSRSLTTPPSSPAEGALYIPATGATGAWAGHANKIVQWANGGWNVYNPFQYQRIYSIADGALIRYVGTTWAVIVGEGDMTKAAYDTDNDGIVDSAETVVDGAITASKIASNAITTAKVADGAITAAKLDPGITIGVADGSVTTAKLADGSVTSAKIADGTIATGDIANDAITFSKLQNITTNRLLGRSSTGSGDVEEIQLGSGLSLSAGTLSSTATGGSIAVSDEGTQLTATATSLNFTGAGVTATNSGGAVTVNIDGSGTGGGLSRAKIHAIIASSL